MKPARDAPSALALGTARALALAMGLATGALLVAPSPAHALEAATTRNYVPGGQWDPQMRAAHFEISDGRYLDATQTLRGLVDRAHGKRLSPQLQRMLADASLGFGLPGPAEHSYRELAADTSNRTALGQAQLDLATQLYNHGYTQQAVTLLHATHASLPGDLEAQWNGLLGRALLRLNRVGEAITALEKAESGPEANYARYNLAVAELRSGHIKNGIKALDRAGHGSVRDSNDVALRTRAKVILGYAAPQDEESLKAILARYSDGLALRDHANVVIGYYFLRHEKAVEAIAAFNRVRLHGPYSNRALLGLGWAYMALSAKSQVPRDAPQQDHDSQDWTPSLGALMRPGFINEAILKNRRVQLMRHLPPPTARGEQATRLRRALVPWSELLDRDPMDAAVQEGMMAVPYALDRVGAHQEALAYYEKAIAALTKTRQRIATARKHVRSGRMIKTMIAADPEAQTGWNWRLIDLPDAVETFYLQRTIADHPFQESLKNYRDLRLLDQTLAHTDARLARLLSGTDDSSREHIPLQFVVNHAQQTGAPPPPVTQGVPIPLALSSQLGSAGLAQAAASTPQAPPPPSNPAAGLTLAPPPAAGFHGVPQQMAAARDKIAALRSELKSALAASAERLQDIALSALATQDETATKYLVQVRLAVARIYDSQGSALGSVPAAPSTEAAP